MMKMEGNNWDRIWMKITVTMLFLFVIFNQGGLFNLEIAADSSSRSTRGSEELEWIQTTQEDFENGIISRPMNETGLEITSTGEIILAPKLNWVIDNFNNETMVGYKENIKIDTSVGEAELFKTMRIYGQGDDNDGRSVLKTSDDGYIITGRTGNYNLWLIKTDENLSEHWNRTFGFDFEGDSGSSTIEIPGGDFVVCGSSESYSTGGSSDVWLIKVNETGIEEWNKTYGGILGDGGGSVRLTSDGGFIITGGTQSYGNGSNGKYDIWLIKTDEFGNEEWNRTFGGTEGDSGTEILITSDSGYLILTNSYSFGLGFPDEDIWLLKTDLSGNLQWSKIFGGADNDGGLSMKKTADGGFIITGFTKSFGSDSKDMWLIKIDAFGNEQWNRTYGASGDDRGESVVQTIDGGYVITGHTDSYGAGDDDVWLIKTQNDGNELWNRTYGYVDPGFDAGRSLDVSNDGGFVIVGETDLFSTGHSYVLLFKTNDQGKINGTLISSNLLVGLNSRSIEEFKCKAHFFPNDRLRVQFSKNGADWYNSSGYLNEWDLLEDGSNPITLSLPGWSGPNFYYKIDITSYTFTNTPRIEPRVDYCRVIFTGYFSEGVFESENYDSNTFPYWKTLNWTATTPPGTDVKFQLKTADSQGFVGPDGSSDSYYTTSGQSIWEGHKRDRYIRYKAILSTSNLSITPILEEVIITYEPIDTDGDGITDFEDLDDDNDDMPDTWESQFGFDPLNHSDSSTDSDSDGLTNIQEFLNKSEPNNTDTDGDNLGDGFEVIFSKTKPDDWDTNNNSIGDGLEFIESQGYLGWIELLPDNWIGMTISWDNYTVYVKTNSSVLEGEFDKDEQKLKIKVSGPEGTSGVTEIDVPKSLCEPDDIEIMLDGELINYTITEDDTYYYIHVEYNHSAHELTADFTRKIEEPIGSEDDDGLPVQYLIILVVVIILTIIILLGITRYRNGFQKNEVPDLPPDELSKMLEDKYAGGEMTDKTYNDIKSLLEKYEDSDDKH
jgi:hypothetical protein